MHLLVAANASKRHCHVASRADFIGTLLSNGGTDIFRKTRTAAGKGDVIVGERLSHFWEPFGRPVTDGGLGFRSNLFHWVVQNGFAGRLRQSSTDTHLLGSDAMGFTETKNRV